MGKNVQEMVPSYIQKYFFLFNRGTPSLDARRTYPRPQHFRLGSSVWHCSVGKKICPTKNLTRPIKLSGRSLYDDGQMINRNVINHVTKTVWVEFVFNKHGCRWRA